MQDIGHTQATRVGRHAICNRKKLFYIFPLKLLDREDMAAGKLHAGSPKGWLTLKLRRPL
jgi:hypothetical protein